jgi:SET domain-containing protein
MKRTKIFRSSINGVGLYAAEDIHKGEKIDYIKGDIRVVRDFSKVSKKLNEISYNWIGVGKYSWIDTKNSIFRFINHSCDPNAIIATPRTVIARKNIRSGEEITMDYSLTEAGQDWSIEDCSCGTKQCRGLILPINKLPNRIYTSYMPYITKKFQRIYKTYNNKMGKYA